MLRDVRPGLENFSGYSAGREDINESMHMCKSVSCDWGRSVPGLVSRLASQRDREGDGDFVVHYVKDFESVYARRVFSRSAPPEGHACTASPGRRKLLDCRRVYKAVTSVVTRSDEMTGLDGDICIDELEPLSAPLRKQAMAKLRAIFKSQAYDTMLEIEQRQRRVGTCSFPDLIPKFHENYTVNEQLMMLVERRRFNFPLASHHERIEFIRVCRAVDLPTRDTLFPEIYTHSPV